MVKESQIFEVLLKESIRVHGHLCVGQVLGVRMTLYGLGEIWGSGSEG
jgi:formylmethanofuran dehydrogenase subunit E